MKTTIVLYLPGARPLRSGRRARVRAPGGLGGRPGASSGRRPARRSSMMAASVSCHSWRLSMNPNGATPPVARPCCPRSAMLRVQRPAWQSARRAPTWRPMYGAHDPLPPLAGAWIPPGVRKAAAGGPGGPWRAVLRCYRGPPGSGACAWQQNAHGFQFVPATYWPVVRLEVQPPGIAQSFQGNQRDFALLCSFRARGGPGLRRLPYRRWVGFRPFGQD